MTYRYRVPKEVMQEAGSLAEFAKDAAIASIRLKSGSVFSPALIVHPDFIAAVAGFDALPFKEEEIEAVFQTSDDLQKRSRSGWTFFTNPT